MSKFKDILRIGTAVGGAIAPGAAGKVLEEVNKHLDSHENTSISPENADLLRKLAADNDEQTAAILALHERVKALEAKLK